MEHIVYNSSMAILDNLDNPSYPEPWHRQTPKGYEPSSKIKEVCNCGCNCQTPVNDLLEIQPSFEE